MKDLRDYSDFITIKATKKLYELGAPLHGFWVPNKTLVDMLEGKLPSPNGEKIKTAICVKEDAEGYFYCCSIHTIDQVFGYLRKDHNINCYVVFHPDSICSWNFMDEESKEYKNKLYTKKTTYNKIANDCISYALRYLEKKLKDKTKAKGV